MQLISQDYKQGIVRLKVENRDDQWYLSHIIEEGDLVKGKTTRKIKIGEGENAKVAKKTFVLGIKAEKIELDPANSTLRINGRIKEGPDDLPKDSYQAISLDVGDECTITKQTWLGFQKKRLKEASKKQFQYLLCVLDRENAILALTTKSGFETLSTPSGTVPKKNREIQNTKDFYADLSEMITQYATRYKPEKIILASPAFYKDELAKKIDRTLFKKVVLATCSSVTQNALQEVLLRPELKAVLQDSRSHQEQMLIEKLLVQIKKEALATYGFEQTTVALDAGAISTLILTEKFIEESKKNQTYTQLDEKMKIFDKQGGEIHIISSDNEPGKKVDGLGGIAALLRYKL